MNNQRLRRLTAGGVMAISLGFVTAPIAGAETIDQVVQKMGGSTPESAVIRYLWQNGFGYLDVNQAHADAAFACRNRKAGVPQDQTISKLQSRGRTAREAQAMIAAERTAIGNRASGEAC